MNGEYTKILESAADTNGEYSLMEVMLKPGGGNPMHYHTRFTEEFFAVEGKLGLGYGKETFYLKPGENKLVPIGAVHRFFNNTDSDIVFRVVLRKGQPDFEKFLKVMFGLVNDGKTVTKNQVPTNIYNIGLLYVWGDTHIDNWLFRLISPLARLFYKSAIRRGVDKKLLEKYP
ncbi:MAG: cupin domain-containing protein [Flavobacterium sp.]|nr:MAG: cupin domain-containing protein [Flavobacterium sp.]